MQIADRFHLHQNLLEAVKKALASNVPHIIKILPEDMSQIIATAENNKNESIPDDSGKKNRIHCG